MSNRQYAKITSFLIKIASRCNLACDYCYMYEHADQSWRQQPKLMKAETRQQIATRIGEYTTTHDVPEILIVFHGGEPLLAGHDSIVQATRLIRESVSRYVRVDASIQTNGVLLSEDAIAAFDRERIGVSVSLDGPQFANDLHRLDHGRNSTFQKTLDAIHRLQKFPHVFSGLISVVDPSVEPNVLFQFFSELRPPRLDFLLPDSNHVRPPQGRDKDADRYARWLLAAFDLWFDRYSDLPIRTFDAILTGVAGMPSQTDAFGFGDISMLMIETDGSYHDLDVLKITSQGATQIGMDIWTSTIAQAAASPKIEAHRSLLVRNGLSGTCQKCDIVDICGGGSVPHRFDGQGFQNPTVYCREMLALVHHAKARVRQALSREASIATAASQRLKIGNEELNEFDNAETGRGFVDKLWRSWSEQSLASFVSAIHHAAKRMPELQSDVDIILASPDDDLAVFSVQPSVFLWSVVMNNVESGKTSKTIDGQTITVQPEYVQQVASWRREGLPSSPRIHRNDRWLRVPFGDRILFEASDDLSEAQALVEESLKLIELWDSAVFAEIRRLSPEIQFIQDPTAHPDKAVSFSDNTVPGALYVSVRRSGGWISVYDLADSIIHEHRHQKLYLLQANAPILTVDSPFVTSPWREELRPPSGLFHAVFVFTGLLRYWRYLNEEGSVDIRDYASFEVRSITEKLETAFPVLFSTSLTVVGRQLATSLANEFESLRQSTL